MPHNQIRVETTNFRVSVAQFLGNMLNPEEVLTLPIKPMTEAEAEAASRYTACRGGVTLTTMSTHVTLTIVGVNFRGSDRLVWWGKCWLGDVIVDYHYDYRSATCVITFFPE